MKSTALIFLFSMRILCLQAQYFFTGEVKDGHGDGLQNGSINVLSTGISYRPGIHGEFGITSRTLTDSVVLLFDGYEPYTVAVSADKFLQITLKSLSLAAVSKHHPVKSVFKDNRTYAENPFVSQSSSVSFAGSVNLASYNLVRKFLDMGAMVPPDAIQIDEMLNYFNLYYESPDTGEVFHCSSDLFTCPWNESHKLLSLNICTKKADLQKAPPANLVFLIDASGSMDLPDKLPLVKSAIRVLVNNLRDNDVVSVISFGQNLRVLLEGMPGSEKVKIIEAVEELAPDGPTAGDQGIKLAYEVAGRQFISGGNNKIILITDGDISEEESGKRQLEDFIIEQSENGISLHCIGVGMEGFKDSALPDLARKGHGAFAQAADEQDAESLLVGEIAPASFCMADSVFISTDFNSSVVKGYRLLGFDNRSLLSGDSVSPRLEGSKIVSGHSLTSLFELVPSDSIVKSDTVAQIQISYFPPGQKAAKMIRYGCPNEPTAFDKADINLKRMACLALFGMKLQGSPYVTQSSWADIEKMARRNFAGNNRLDRDYIELVAKAKHVYRQGH